MLSYRFEKYDLKENKRTNVYFEVPEEVDLAELRSYFYDFCAALGYQVQHPVGKTAPPLSEETE